MQSFAHYLAIATTLLTAAGMAWCFVVLVAALSFRLSARKAHTAFTPPVSILKPVKGHDEGLYEAFRSHCQQDYAGSYELIFGASSADDSAVADIHRLIAEFPTHAIKLVLCPERLGTNGKVSNLIQMLPYAQHPFVIVNDADIRVSPRYLTRILAPFADEKTGMVTTLYRGRSHSTLGSILEALGIATDFVPGVLAACLVERGIRFGLGSTLAMRRAALEASGGFEAVVDQLADDYELGARIARSGYTVHLSNEVVETSVPPYHISGFLQHQLRWARTVRDSRQWGYLGLLVTHTLPLAALNVLASGFSFLSLWLFGLAFFLRLGTAMRVGAGILNDRQVLAYLWLLPLRDFVGFFVWIWSFAGNTIHWRGEEFILKNGKLHKPA
ncbi:MAG TPA: bacteriohopanetetrol glucosamine biosynthesis glycosyltransferase HpnI [Acidobacteriaceae bacterium]